MTIQSIEQQRAKYALKKVKAITNDKSEWLSRANEMPAMIQMNGLGQTVAFYLSKGGVHKKMYDLLSEWLCNNENKDKKDKNEKLNIFKENDLMQGIVNADIQTYRKAQAEAQALLIWVKKFSKAYCTEEESNNTTGESHA